ncbi:MAG: agmatine deiminase family protein [Elusimicrobiota bacterium]
MSAPSTRQEDRRTPKSLGFRMPAEWEPHEAIWLSWPHDPVTFEGVLPQVERTFARIAAQIHKTEEVRLLVLNEAMRARAGALLSSLGADLSRIRFLLADYADVWIRDYGPTFLTHPLEKRLAMVHWIFNAWGGKYEELKKDALIPDLILAETRATRFKPGIVMEGGSFDVNGKGVVMTTEQCLLHKNRNPSLGRGELEDALRGHLGAEEVLWLKEGVAGDDTDGHIDDIARFVSPDTVLCALEERTLDPNHGPLKENFELLRSAKPGGLRLSVEPLPMPEPVLAQDGSRLPASYANFYIGNGTVLAPVFECRQDEKALRTLEQAFPGRSIAPIPCRELVRGLGTIHCASQQQPSRGGGNGTR